MSFTDLMPFFFILLTILGAAVQIWHENRRIGWARKSEIILTWAFAIIIGIGGIFGFIGHTFFADRVADSIGWPTGNPFQKEVGFANLSIGLLGLFSTRIAGSFRVATLLSYGIFMIGAGLGHLWQISTAHNLSVNNTGPVLWLDLFMPVILIGLYILTEHLKLEEERPSLSR